MRLINIKYGKNEGPKLEDFTFSTSKPTDYRIFSHRWLSDKEYGGDITFKEFNDSEDQLKEIVAIEDPKKRKAEIVEKLGRRSTAFNKLLRAIETAKQRGASHLWIDSCCINRESSSELTEALNSMYQYYEESEECLVYLHDFEGLSKPYDFSNQEWFTRGWTLQELIAPKEVYFYNQNWDLIGTRSQDAVAEAISKVTKIPMKVLNGEHKPNDYSVAQRMSWAANRRTLRDEDMSYSLFGLFDINLTPIYGEGARKAFLRLQEAIMSSTNDMSIFAWISTEPDYMYRGVLARSPKEFQHAGDLVHRKFMGPNPEFSMTNKGLKIMPLLSIRPNGAYFMPLNCAKSESRPGESLGIYLSTWDKEDERLYRYRSAELPSSDQRPRLKQSETPIYIARDERWKDVFSGRRNSASSRTKVTRSKAGPKDPEFEG